MSGTSSSRPCRLCLDLIGLPSGGRTVSERTYVRTRPVDAFSRASTCLPSAADTQRCHCGCSKFAFWETANIGERRWLTSNPRLAITKALVRLSQILLMIRIASRTHFFCAWSNQGPWRRVAEKSPPILHSSDAYHGLCHFVMGGEYAP
jgi:hypothetical protein